MPLTFNMRHLEKRSLRLVGELSPAELEVLNIDELVNISQPLRYDLTVERLNDSVLVRGELSCALDCECARCLAPYSRALEIPDWTCDLPLEGEDNVVISNDCVDLTPYLREDILLALPQHPLCQPECRGLLDLPQNANGPASVEEQASSMSPAWAELNKLKF